MPYTKTMQPLADIHLFDLKRFLTTDEGEDLLLLAQDIGLSPVTLQRALEGLPLQDETRWKIGRFLRDVTRAPSEVAPAADKPPVAITAAADHYRRQSILNRQARR